MAETAAAELIGRETGIGKNTVLRALGKGSQEADIRLDTLVRLAAHFGATAADLIHEDVRLTYPRPSTAKGSNKIHDRARAEGKDSENRAPLQRLSRR